MKYNNIITLVMGDPYADGHGMSEKINISSNLTNKEITKAYTVGKKKLSFNFDSLCEDYEDSRFTKKQCEEFRNLGYKDDQYDGDCPGDIYDPDDEDSDFVLDTEGFAKLYLFLVKLGNNEFEYEILTDKQNPTIEIGGYGLFSR